MNMSSMDVYILLK